MSQTATSQPEEKGNILRAVFHFGNMEKSSPNTCVSRVSINRMKCLLHAPDTLSCLYSHILQLFLMRDTCFPCQNDSRFPYRNDLRFPCQNDSRFLGQKPLTKSRGCVIIFPASEQGLICRNKIFRGIAQLVEQRSPKPRAEGSSPSAPAKLKSPRNGLNKPFFGLFFLCFLRGARSKNALLMLK